MTRGTALSLPRLHLRNVRRSILPLLVLTIGCAFNVRFGAHSVATPVIAISNPTYSDGDPIAGRRTFIAVQCVDCHRVAEDPALPRGRRAVAGPLLGNLNRYAPPELANRIVGRETGADQELFSRTMKDYAQPMTARQLVDIVAYLRNPKPPRS